MLQRMLHTLRRHSKSFCSRGGLVSSLQETCKNLISPSRACTLVGGRLRTGESIYASRECPPRIFANPCPVSRRDSSTVLGQNSCGARSESMLKSCRINKPISPSRRHYASKTQSGLIRVALREFDRWGPYCENRRIAMELGAALSFQKLRQTPCEVHKIGWHHNHRGAVVLRSHLGDHLHTPQFQSGWIPHHQLRGVGQFLRCF